SRTALCFVWPWCAISVRLEVGKRVYWSRTRWQRSSGRLTRIRIRFVLVFIIVLNALVRLVLIVGGDRRVDQAGDLDRLLDAVVLLEGQDRGEAHLEPGGDTRLEEPGCVLESAERELLLAGRAHHRDVDRGVALVAGHLDPEHGHRLHARVSDLEE